MPTTYEAIATVTVGSGGAANIEFTSIPATFTDLALKISARSDTTRASNGFLMDIRLNGSSSNGSRRSLYDDGGTVASASGSDTYNIVINSSDLTASTFSSADIYIPNYTSTTAAKSISSDSASENNGAASLRMLGAMLWNPATQAAVTSITMTCLAGNFVQYSTATLYGIKNS